jgi:uncharacterized damage-inducible protein DinB
MTRLAPFALCFVLLATMAAPVGAQETALRDELLRDWRDMQVTLQRLAGEMPDAAFDYKPTEPQRTFAQQVLHVATANLLNLGFLGDGLPPPAADRADLGRAAVMAAMTASFDHGAAVLERHDDAWLMEVVETNAFLGPSSRARVVWFLLGHSWDIYGQMAVYLRLNGATPPASQRP